MATTTTTTKFSIAATTGTPSRCCDRPGALDYTATVTITAATSGNERTVTGGVTLVPDTINGGLTHYGDTLDTWLESQLAEAVAALGRRGSEVAQAIEQACEYGESVEIEVWTDDDVSRYGQADGEEDVETVLAEQEIDVVRATLAPGHVSWDEGARSAAAHKARRVPAPLEEVYYAAYAAAGRERAAELVGDAE